MKDFREILDFLEQKSIIMILESLWLNLQEARIDLEDVDFVFRSTKFI